MRVLVFDRVMRVVGHRLPYASLVADELGKQHEVVLSVPIPIQENPESCVYMTQNFRTDYFETGQPKTSIGIALETRKNLIDQIQKHQPDAVAIPTADGLAQVSGCLNTLGNNILRKTPIHICVMRGLQVLPDRPIKQRLSHLSWLALKKGPWENILVIDPREWSRLKETEKTEIGLCPDPVPAPLSTSRTDARKKLGLPVEGKLIVSPGEQSHRKGTDLLLNAFACAEFDPMTYLVLMGKLTESSRQLLSDLTGKKRFQDTIIVRDQFLTEEEFQLAILASDVVATPYRSVNRPSGIVFRCIAWNRMLTFNDRGWLRWMNKKCNFGFGADAETSSDYAKALKACLQASETFETSDEAKSFIEFNSEANFRNTWATMINSGRKPATPEFLNS